MKYIAAKYIITCGNECVNRLEVQSLSQWCSVNNLILKTTKTNALERRNTHSYPWCPHRNLSTRLTISYSSATVKREQQQRLLFPEDPQEKNNNILVRSCCCLFTDKQFFASWLVAFLCFARCPLPSLSDFVKGRSTAKNNFKDITHSSQYLYDALWQVQKVTQIQNLQTHNSFCPHAITALNKH